VTRISGNDISLRKKHPVIDQDIGAYGGHTFRVSVVEQRCNQAGSDPSALPGILDQDSQIEESCGTGSDGGHSHAG